MDLHVGILRYLLLKCGAHLITGLEASFVPVVEEDVSLVALRCQQRWDIKFASKGG